MAILNSNFDPLISLSEQKVLSSIDFTKFLTILK